MKNILKLLLLGPLLMAFQCDDEIESDLKFNTFKASVTPQSIYSVDDVVWIEGYISSKVFDTSVNDSIFTETPGQDYFSIMRLIDSDPLSNSIDAIDQFELIFDRGVFDTVGFCENSEMTAQGVLNDDESLYTYRLGLKALQAGDYMISFDWRTTLNNTDRNEAIITDYLLTNHPNQIGFNKCGDVSWKFLNETNGELYFTVN